MNCGGGTSTAILLVSMKVLLKYLSASAASSADLNPTKPNCLEVPSLHRSRCNRHNLNLNCAPVVLHSCKNTYFDLTTLASVTSPLAEKCSRSLASLTYFGRPFTQSLLVIVLSKQQGRSSRCLGCTSRWHRFGTQTSCDREIKRLLATRCLGFQFRSFHTLAAGILLPTFGFSKLTLTRFGFSKLTLTR